MENSPQNLTGLGWIGVLVIGATCAAILTGMLILNRDKLGGSSSSTTPSTTLSTDAALPPVQSPENNTNVVTPIEEIESLLDKEEQELSEFPSLPPSESEKKKTLPQEIRNEPEEPSEEIILKEEKIDVPQVDDYQEKVEHKEVEEPIVDKEVHKVEEQIEHFKAKDHKEEEPSVFKEQEEAKEPSSVEEVHLPPIEKQIKNFTRLSIFNSRTCNVKSVALSKLAKLFAFLLQRGVIKDLPLSNLRPKNNMKSTLAMLQPDALQKARKSGDLFLACLPLAPVLVCGTSTNLVDLAFNLQKLGPSQFSANNYLELLKMMRERLLQETDALYYKNDTLPNLAAMLQAYNSNEMATLDEKIINSVGMEAYNFLNNLNNFNIAETALEETKAHIGKLYERVIPEAIRLV